MAQQFSSILVFFQTSSLIEKIKDKKLSRKYSKFSVLAQYDVLLYRMFELLAINISITYVMYIYVARNECLELPMLKSTNAYSPKILHKKESNIAHNFKIKYQN